MRSEITKEMVEDMLPGNLDVLIDHLHEQLRTAVFGIVRVVGNHHVDCYKISIDVEAIDFQLQGMQ